MAHITGGGVYENLPRVLPQGLGAEIHRGSWPIPPIFGLIQQLGQVELAEMFRVFNMGLGYLIVMKESSAEQALQILGVGYRVGRIVEGAGVRVV